MADRTLEVVQIRSARHSDLRALEWDGEYTTLRPVFEHAFEEAQAGHRLILVAEAGGVVVGQVFVQLNSAEHQFADGVTRGYMYALRVRPEWRNQGLGTKLVAAAEAELRRLGFTTAVIAAGKENPGARRLYERLGFRIFADDPGVWYFTDVNGTQQARSEPCWVMEKRL